jgi:hypothetical protein
MKAKNADRVQFPYKHGRATFDVFFFIDEKPFSLLFGAKQFNIVFELPVLPGFAVDCYLSDETYKALCKALGLTYDPDNPFSTRAFLSDFETHILSSVSRVSIPRPHDLVIYKSDVEENEKIYFCGWRDNTPRGEKVTAHNLHKTRRLLGERAFEVCNRKNLSSYWTHDKSKSIPVSVPQ